MYISTVPLWKNNPIISNTKKASLCGAFFVLPDLLGVEIAENPSVAERRGQSRKLIGGSKRTDHEMYKTLFSTYGLGRDSSCYSKEGGKTWLLWAVSGLCKLF